MPPAGGGNIKVVVRVRPFNSREKERNAKCIVQMKGAQTVLSAPPNTQPTRGKGGKEDDNKVFAFDKSYWSFERGDSHYAGQEDLHSDLGKPLLDNAFQGYNNCIFAYGQTGSGKSYSMMGYGPEAGVIPKICQDMFQRIGALQEDKNLRCTVEVSYLEIYNERVRDLLNPTTKGNLKVREHPSTGPYVEDLAKLVVSSFSEIENLMDEGNKARTVAATNMNETSSRSHAVFTLTLTQKRHDVETNMGMEKVAKISLVDLAGSERANSTGATGARLKEGAEINRSLSTLGRVIASLADLSDGKKKNVKVPYRDSVLTWLLKDSLGGNSMTAMIAAISPADINFDETLSTLRYADSAKRIKNHAVVNEDANARMIRELKEELATLRSKLTGGGGSTEETYAEGTPLDKQIVSIVQPDGTVKKVSKAEIAEQLNQSEKLYSDLNQTWEEKLQKTEEIHKEREAALEELGISIEKGFVGLHTPKKMPHLVNLSDDPLLAECLVYNLKPGTTTVGNVDSATTAEIRLNGSRIFHDHCNFENQDNKVTLIPQEGAAVMVNGKRVVEPTRLRSGYRVILGDFHIFRFNHPLEARAERAEQNQSLLRHSITASQVADYEKSTPSPSPRPGHERTISKAMDFDWEGSRPESPMPAFQNGRDSDWSFARREAAGAILGPDQKIAGLSDDELNILFEDVQRARAERAVRETDDDMDSNTSYPVREKYLSNGTIDNFSLDTALTMPSTPKQGEVEDKMREVREEMQVQLDKQKEEYQSQLQTAEAANVEVEEIKKEKAKMVDNLREVKEVMLKQLEMQRQEFEERLQQLDPASSMSKGPPPLTEAEIFIAKKTFKHWRGRRYVQMAEAVLQYAHHLKEAQIMSQEMDEGVVFQFTVVDVGHYLCSSYDMVLNDISREGEDLHLEEAVKPCVGVRVIDYRNSVIHLWSLEKLKDRVTLMRQMHQYMDRPEYLQHFQLDNPFMETCMPQYTHVGDVEVPLAAVFESRVHDFTLDVLSPYTSQAIGIINLALEPSSARAPSSTLKFNVVMHEMVGFPEREGTELHGQLFVPGIEGGVTTTQMISEFDERPVKFESVHSISIPLFSPADLSLRIAIFAKVTSMHLDKLLSWDEMRDNVPKSKKRKAPRLAESHFYTEDKHDVFGRIQILELAENGEYHPVEVVQSSATDNGAFQLHQGLQRRIAINLAHSSGGALPWDEISNIRVGHIQLIDHAGKTPDLTSPTPAMPLKLVARPTLKTHANGTSNVTMIGQWDSSVHESLLLDRVTKDKYKIQMTLQWDVASKKLAQPMTFSIDLCSQIRSRSYIRSTSMFAALWQTIRILHSVSSIFSIAVRPSPVKTAGDLWRMNTGNDYVKGEEFLETWTPRGISLIRDHIAAKLRKIRLVELEAAAPLLKKINYQPVARTSEVHPDVTATGTKNGENVDELHGVTKDQQSTNDPNEQQTQLLEKFTMLWKRSLDPSTSILKSGNVEPPRNGILSAAHKPPPHSVSPATRSRSSSPSYRKSLFLAAITPVVKNATVLKSGYLLTPSADSSKWVRRFVELRHPYLHLHSLLDGEEVSIVSLYNSRIDHNPQIAKLLKRGPGGNAMRGRAGDNPEESIFAVYGTDNTWLFKARGEREKVEWIFKIDQAYFGSGDVLDGVV
ncbi:kinesin heavy chain [Calycina marina]|uniref:Kinesin heavy chain n=1 Tax=Calycina marina TaxID=1763456 RepID=A0A9P7Z6Z5_9HELO|nr:kinesin heavy chain [Calycina marina]